MFKKRLKKPLGRLADNRPQGASADQGNFYYFCLGRAHVSQRPWREKRKKNRIPQFSYRSLEPDAAAIWPFKWDNNKVQFGSGRM